LGSLGKEEGLRVRVLYETELVKNCLIPMSDGVTLAADLYRPRVDEPVPALMSFYPYHKDDDMGPGYFEGALRALAQAGYACLLVDVRGTGSSGGHTAFPQMERERRDYHEAVEWVAGQPWCDGEVGVWGLSYGSIAALLTAVENPPHLGAVAAFHGARVISDDFLCTGGRLGLLQAVANWSSWMAGQNFMPPGYRDPQGRWLTVWREHLEHNVPYLVTALDRLWSSPDGFQPTVADLKRIDSPVFLWVGWHDLFPKAMVEAYQSVQGPKKMTVGPWVHVMPDVGHAGRVDYLLELQRWFDHWLRGVDTGVMDEPPVAMWVQGEEAWVYEDDFPPAEVEVRVLYLDEGGTLSESPPRASGSDTFPYDATVGVCSDLVDPMGVVTGLPRDQRFDEIKGKTYTTAPLAEDLEICGVPQTTVKYSSGAQDKMLVVKLCDVAPDGRSTLITEGWVDDHWAKTQETTWGQVSEDGSSVRLSLVPTSYVVRSGHRLRVFIAGSNFPRLLPSVGPGEITVEWGAEPLSLVGVPVRLPRAEVRRPDFTVAPEVPHVPVAASTWRIEQDPVAATTTVRMEYAQSLGIDGGEGPATVTYTHRCSATASQAQPSQPSAHAESEACWESDREQVKLETAMVFRPVELDLNLIITLNGVPYWQKQWHREWLENGARAGA
jgi:putative CocE/NonD family hydrolase